MGSKYRTETMEISVSVEEYLENCVAVDEFLEFCKECPGFNNSWACPPFAFDAESYWKSYQTLKLFAVKLIFPKILHQKEIPFDERQKQMEDMIGQEKKKLTEQLFRMEKQIEGSVALSAGSCQFCENGCAKREGRPCRYPEQLRYSIEALGGNVGLTARKYFKQEPEWIEEGELPHTFLLICGLLEGRPVK